MTKNTHLKEVFILITLQVLLKTITEFFGERIVETGFRKAFKGNWGSEEHTRARCCSGTKSFELQCCYFSFRKINLPLDSSAKVIGPRLLHSSQWGIIDPVDTPDGGNVGLHKHMAISAAISSVGKTNN